MRSAKSYEELDITDDFMFGKVMSTRLDLTQELLERILGVPIRKVELAESQKTIEIIADAKGIRLDVYLDDAEGTVYNVEMEKPNKRDWRAQLPKRTRYYQALIDLNLLERGSVFTELAQTYVIFICLKDPFDEGRYKYTFENRCVENTEFRLGDDTTKIFVNAGAKDPDIPEKLKVVFDYFNDTISSDDFTERLDEAVEEARRHEKWRTEYMLYGIKLQEQLIEGRAEGREEGRAEGREEGRAEGREEGRAEGREEGRAEGRKEGLELGRAEGKAQGLAEGRTAGQEEGRELSFITLVIKKYRRGKNTAETAEALETEEERVRKVYDALEQLGPDADEHTVYELLQKS